MFYKKEIHPKRDSVRRGFHNPSNSFTIPQWLRESFDRIGNVDQNALTVNGERYRAMIFQGLVPQMSDNRGNVVQLTIAKLLFRISTEELKCVDKAEHFLDALFHR